MGWIDFLRSIWYKIKRFFVKCLSFVKNIVGFFKDPERLAKLKKDKNVIATTIKERLANGNYNTVSCLFNTVTNEVEDLQVDAQGFESEDIDSQTAMAFGDKEMIVLQ